MGKLQFPLRTHHRGWCRQRTEALLASIHESDLNDVGVCVVGNLQSKLTFESSECLASMAVYNWSENTCLPYKQRSQVLRQGHRWKWTQRFFRFSRKIRLFFLERSHIQMSTEESVAAFSRQSKSRTQTTAGTVSTSVHLQIHIWRHFSECCGELKAVKWKMCELTVGLWMQQRVLSVSLLRVSVYLCVLSSAQLPQLCSDFAQLCFDLQQLLWTDEMRISCMTPEYTTHVNALDYSLQITVKILCAYRVLMKLTAGR